MILESRISATPPANPLLVALSLNRDATPRILKCAGNGQNIGREATCLCQLGESTAQVKALLEPPDLILRGQIRQRIPVTQSLTLRDIGLLDVRGISVSLCLPQSASTTAQPYLARCGV